MTDLTNKVAVVTGASSGIGAAIVKELLQLGMKVVGLARRKAKVDELGEGYAGMLFALETDVTKEQDILGAFTWIENNLGPIHLLVNNAGVGGRAPMDDAKTETIKCIIDTNLVALTLFTREAIKSMKANNVVDGIIININSVVGHYILNVPGSSIYSASKFGVTAFTEAIRGELAANGSKIRITSLSPGLVHSEMTEKYIEHQPYIRAEDIAQGVKYILMQPSNVNVAELMLRPVGKGF